MSGGPVGDARVRFGRSGEALAEAYLTARGFHLIERRFRLRNGEIDLVMADGPTVVFVEVRRRSTASLGDPLESIGPRKRSRIIRAARVFLSMRRLHERPCRFDVVAVRDGGPGEPPVLEHRADAFRADGTGF
jgi:putative endonuclease